MLLGTYFLYHCFLEATTPFLSKLYHSLLRSTITNAHYVIPTQQTRKHTPLAISLLARTTFPSLLYFNCFNDIPHGTPSSNLQSFRLVIKSSSTLYNAVQTYRPLTGIYTTNIITIKSFFFWWILTRIYVRNLYFLSFWERHTCYMTFSARYCIIIDALPNLTVSDYFLPDELNSLLTANTLICFVNVRATHILSLLTQSIACGS